MSLLLNSRDLIEFADFLGSNTFRMGYYDKRDTNLKWINVKFIPLSITKVSFKASWEISKQLFISLSFQCFDFLQICICFFSLFFHKEETKILTCAFCNGDILQHNTATHFSQISRKSSKKQNLIIRLKKLPADCCFFFFFFVSYTLFRSNHRKILLHVLRWTTAKQLTWANFESSNSLQKMIGNNNYKPVIS